MERETAAAIKGQVRTSGRNLRLWCDPARLTLTHAWECLCDPKSLASPEATGWSREPWPRRLCSGPCPSVLEIWGPGTEGRGPKLQELVKEKAGLWAEDKVREEAVVERRGYGSSSDTWERCPQGFCASRVKRPPLSLWRVVHPNPGDRPTTFPGSLQADPCQAPV